MSGPDVAFLNNVPIELTSSSTIPKSPSSSDISSTTYSLLSTTLSTAIASLSTSSSTTSTSTSTSISLTATATSGPSNNPNEPESIYFYDPSLALAITFTILYALLIPYHFYHSIYTPRIAKLVSQKHSYTIPLFIATTVSTAGFALRCVSVPSISSVSWIVIAPIFICATLYLLVVHLIRLCLPSGTDAREQVFLGLIPEWLRRIFITSDITSFLCQGVGSGIANRGNWRGKTGERGNAIQIFGSVAQTVTFTVYLVVLYMFCKRVCSGRRSGDEKESNFFGASASGREYGFNPLVKVVVRGMWIASVLVEFHSIYRLIEFGMGVDGYSFSVEWALWAFEAVPIWITLVVLGWYHPVVWLQQKRRSAFLDKKGRNGNGYVGDRANTGLGGEN